MPRSYIKLQYVASLSRRRHGFDSRTGRQFFQSLASPFSQVCFGSPKFAAVRDQLVLGRGNECPEHFGPIEITVEAHSNSVLNPQRQRRDHAFTELRHHDPIAIAHPSVLEHLTLLQLLTSLLLTIFAPDPSMKMAAGHPDSIRPAPRLSPHHTELLF